MPTKSPVWVKRVAFVMSAICPVYPKQQTFSDPVGTSHLCQERSFLGWLWASVRDRTWFQSRANCAGLW
jgi:hypothetical protein